MCAVLTANENDLNKSIDNDTENDLQVEKYNLRKESPFDLFSDENYFEIELFDETEKESNAIEPIMLAKESCHQEYSNILKTSYNNYTCSLKDKSNTSSNKVIKYIKGMFECFSSTLSPSDTKISKVSQENTINQQITLESNSKKENVNELFIEQILNTAKLRPKNQPIEV